MYKISLILTVLFFSSTSFAAKSLCSSAVAKNLAEAKALGDQDYIKAVRAMTRRLGNKVGDAVDNPGRNKVEDALLVFGSVKLVDKSPDNIKSESIMFGGLKRQEVFHRDQSNPLAVRSLERVMMDGLLATESRARSPYAQDKLGDRIQAKPSHLGPAGNAVNWPLQVRTVEQDKQDYYEHGFRIDLVAGPSNAYREYTKFLSDKSKETGKRPREKGSEFLAFNPFVTLMIKVGEIDLSLDKDHEDVFTPFEDYNYDSENHFQSKTLYDTILWAFERTQKRFEHRKYITNVSELELQTESFEQAHNNNPVHDVSSLIVAARIYHPEAPMGAMEENLYFLQQVHKRLKKVAPQAFTKIKPIK